MAEQRFSVPPAPTKTANKRTSQRAKRAIEYLARGASSYETLLRASGIARRRAEEEEQTTLYRLRATTKSADLRDARAVMKQGRSHAEASMT